MSTYNVLVSALLGRGTATIAYRKPSGIVQVRPVRPTAIEMCANGNTIVRAVCPFAEAAGKNAWRSFTLVSIESAMHGDQRELPITLRAAARVISAG